MTTNAARSEEHVADLIDGECLAVRVRLLNRTITGIYDEALRSLSMTVGQSNILVAVAELGGARSMQRVADTVWAQLGRE